MTYKHLSILLDRSDRVISVLAGPNKFFEVYSLDQINPSRGGGGVGLLDSRLVVSACRVTVPLTEQVGSVRVGRLNEGR